MSLEAGRQLAHYRIVEKIGEGGMGVVWKARDTRLDREVVIKLLPVELEADTERLARLELEAKTVASINHPNIVTLYSVEEADGIRFLTMEWIDGRSLTEVVPTQGLALNRFFDIAIALTDAVSAAHERGVTHRDLKPANVMVTPEGRVKVLDFGLAKATEAAEDRDPSERSTRGLTEAGRVLGTIMYMSPEQVRGETVDHRSDIFSLGIVLYEMATGERPFKGDSSAEIISALLRDTPRSVTDLKPGLPGHLARIVRACLEKDPDRRYQSAKDLRNALEDLKIEVSTGSWRAQVDAMRPRRRRARIAAAAAMVVAAAGILGTMVWLGSTGGPRTTAAETVGPSIAVLPFENLSPDPSNAYFADGMTEELIGTLARIPGLRVPARTTVEAYRGVEMAAERIGVELGVQTVLEGSVRKQGEQLRIAVRLVDAATGFQLWSETFNREMRDVFAIQDEISQAIAAKLKVRLAQGSSDGATAPTTNIEAFNLYLQGRFLWNQRTEEGIRASIDRFERAIVADPGFALAHAGIADAWVILPGYSDVDSEVAFPNAREAALRALEIDPNLAEAHTSLAMVLWSYDHDPEASAREYRRALELDPDYATAHHWFALLLGSDLETREEALEHLRRAEELDPMSRIIKAAYGSQMLKVGRIDDGIAKIEELRRLDPDYPAHDAMAWAYMARQRYGDAIAVLEQGVRDGGPPKLAAYLASLYHATGRFDDELALADDTPRGPSDTFAPQLARIRAHAAQGAAESVLVEDVDAALAHLDRTSALELHHLAAELLFHGQPRLANLVAETALTSPPPPKYEDRPDPWRSLGLASCALLADHPDATARWLAEAGDAIEETPDQKSGELRAMLAGVRGLFAVQVDDAPALSGAVAELESLDAEGDAGEAAFWHANVLAAAGQTRAAVDRLDDAFARGFSEPLSLHASELRRLLDGDPAFRARLELLGLN